MSEPMQGDGQPQSGMQKWADASKGIQSGANLAPQDFPSMMQLAMLLQKSAMLPKALRGDPAGTVLVLTQAVQMGLPWTVALKELYVVDGKVSCSAQLLRSLVERDPACKLFYVESFTAEQATVVVQRKEMPEPIRVQFTMKEAIAAGLAGRNPNYKTRPADMMIARASGRAAKAFFPSATLGLVVEGDDEAPLAPPLAATVAQDKPKSAVAAAIASGPVFGGGTVIDADLVEDVVPEPPAEPEEAPEEVPAPVDYAAEDFAERVVAETKTAPPKGGKNVPGGGLIEQLPQPEKKDVLTDDQIDFALDLANSRLGIWADTFNRKYLAEVGLQLGPDQAAKERMRELTTEGYRQYLTRVETAARKVETSDRPKGRR